MVEEGWNIDRCIVDSSAVLHGSLVRSSIPGSITKLLFPRALQRFLEYQTSITQSQARQIISALDRCMTDARAHGWSWEWIGESLKEHECRQMTPERMDDIVRGMAAEQGALLLTGSHASHAWCVVQGLPAMLLEPLHTEQPIHQYLDHETMSLHLLAGERPVAKRGQPGSWRFVECSQETLSTEDLERYISSISHHPKSQREVAGEHTDVFVTDHLRVLVVRPPYASTLTVTVVKSLVERSLKEYTLSPKLKLRSAATGGMLIAGPPGNGKSTLAAAFVREFARQGRVIYTVESPRDLQVPSSIVQLSKDHTTSDELRRTLLLSRPDYVVFDEMRSPDDMSLYADLRLSGIGLLGVIHASQPIDALSRMLPRLEVGMLPHVVDTVLFVEHGVIAKVLGLRLEVKVPAGIGDSNQARPVVLVRDFETEELLYEVYSYGDGVVVMPLAERKAKEDAQIAALQTELAALGIQRLDTLAARSFSVIVSRDLYPRLATGNQLATLEKKYDVRLTLAPPAKEQQAVPRVVTTNRPALSEQPSPGIEVTLQDQTILLAIGGTAARVGLHIDGTFIAHLNIGEKRVIKVKRENALGLVLEDALKSKKSITAVVPATEVAQLSTL